MHSVAGSSLHVMDGEAVVLVKETDRLMVIGVVDGRLANAETSLGFRGNDWMRILGDFLEIS